MEEKYKQTENSMPLYKAYNTFENPNQTYEERTELYPGPGSPTIHPSMQSNGFSNYVNSGGISRKEYLRGEINSIAQKIAMAKEMKGTLCLNNGKANGGTWKTPSLDLALKGKAGYGGGETAARFYTKFPIYRPRGAAPPDVTDDISKVWNEQLTANPNKPSFLIDQSFRTSKNFSTMRGEEDESFRYKKGGGLHQRSASLANGDTKSMLRLTGRNTI